jgi:predicted GNAT family N-acyltransferase
MLKIREYKIGEEYELYQLIKIVYDEFVAPDYSMDGNTFFYDFIKPENFINRYLLNNNIILIAEMNSVNVGMIEFRDENHIALMFVDKAYQKQGIAKALFNEALKRCLARNSKVSKIEVNASPYSISIYEKLGFTKVSEIKENHGIKYFPMVMNLNV